MTKPGRGLERGGDAKTILNTSRLAIQAAKLMICTALLGQFRATDRENIVQAEH